MKEEKNIVTNPLQEISIGKYKYNSLIEIYVINKDFYNKLSSIINPYNIKISAVVKDFFKTTPKPSKSKSYYNRIKHYKEKWETFINVHRLKIEKIEELEKLMKGLVDSTLVGQCTWEKKSYSIVSGVRINNFTAIYDNVNFHLQATSYRNADDELKTSLELSKEDMDKKVEVCPGDYNSILYNVVKKTAIQPKKETSYVRKYELRETKKEVQINHRDFVIKTNLFRCFYKEHLVEEIIGILRIITPLGKEIVERVPCAYCSECNCFYILISEYNRVSGKGILLCQLLNMEEYYKSGISNKFAGSKESTLMRNGYNVKANIGLTDIQRQIILKNIIDSEILTPHRIASYIDTFIVQKKNLPQYDEAIIKWQKDKNYVFSYNKDERRRVDIKSITK